MSARELPHQVLNALELARPKGKQAVFYSLRGYTKHGRLRTEQSGLCQRPGQKKGCAEACETTEKACLSFPKPAALRLSELHEATPSPRSTRLAWEYVSCYPDVGNLASRACDPLCLEQTSTASSLFTCFQVCEFLF